MAILNTKSKNIILKKSSDLFNLTKGNLVTKRNLYDLIQFSKKKRTKYWDGPENIIGNTPQQGINWIGDHPNITGVIIKTRLGSYKQDGWYNARKTIYHYSFKSRNNVINKKEKANAVLIQQIESQYPIMLFTETKNSNWKFEGMFTVESIKKNYVILKFKKTIIGNKNLLKPIKKEEPKTNNFTVKKSKELLSLSEGITLTKRNMFDLIRLSKDKTSKCWDELENIIGNTPMQGINWIGDYPNIKGVIIKMLPGSYEEDSLNDFNEASFNYSFKAKQGVINLQERANLVLTNQINSNYPILLFTTKSKQDPNWQFKGQFEVKKIHKKHIELSKLNSGTLIKTKKANMVEKSIALHKKPITRKNTKSNLVPAPDLKKIFTEQFALEKSFKCGEGNPFHITFLKNDYYVFLKNISPAYYDNTDIARIQLPKSPHFNNILLSKFPFIILGYNDQFETFTSWDPEKTKKRLNSKSNVSLFTRNSFQNKSSAFTTHIISNGAKVVVFPKKLLPSFFLKQFKFFKSELNDSKDLSQLVKNVNDRLKPYSTKENKPTKHPKEKQIEGKSNIANASNSEIKSTEKLKEINPSKLKNNANEIKKFELEVLELFSKNPFLAHQKYNEYMSKLKLNKKEIIEGFERLINEFE